MIVLSAQGTTGKRLIVIGLSAENIRRMGGDQPILRDISAIIPGIELLIFTGETEESMLEEIRAQGVKVDIKYNEKTGRPI